MVSLLLLRLGVCLLVTVAVVAFELFFFFLVSHTSICAFDCLIVVQAR